MKVSRTRKFCQMTLTSHLRSPDWIETYELQYLFENARCFQTLLPVHEGSNKTRKMGRGFISRWGILVYWCFSHEILIFGNKRPQIYSVLRCKTKTHARIQTATRCFVKYQVNSLRKYFFSMLLSFTLDNSPLWIWTLFYIKTLNKRFY